MVGPELIRQSPVAAPLLAVFVGSLLHRSQMCITTCQRRLKPCNPSTNVELDNSTIIDVDDCKVTSNDSVVPMFVRHPGAMLEEIDSMGKEVEMEDIDELVLGINSCDKDNPLAVTEYIDDIYAYYKKVESTSCVPSTYVDAQPDINERMRAILIDWLIEVHYKFELMEETLYLTVNLIDQMALKFTSPRIVTNWVSY